MGEKTGHENQRWINTTTEAELNLLLMSLKLLGKLQEGTAAGCRCMTSQQEALYDYDGKVEATLCFLTDYLVAVFVHILLHKKPGHYFGKEFLTIALSHHLFGCKPGS